MIQKIKIIVALIAFISFGLEKAMASKLPTSKNCIISKERDTIAGNDTIVAYIKVYDSIQYIGVFTIRL